MDIKETLEQLSKFTEGAEDLRTQAARLRNKAEDLGLECTTLSSGFDNSPMVTVNIYLPNDRNVFTICLRQDRPALFEYGTVRLYKEDFRIFVDNVNKMAEIAKAL